MKVTTDQRPNTIMAIPILDLHRTGRMNNVQRSLEDNALRLMLPGKYCYLASKEQFCDLSHNQLQNNGQIGNAAWTCNIPAQKAAITKVQLQD